MHSVDSSSAKVIVEGRTYTKDQGRGNQPSIEENNYQESDEMNPPQHSVFTLPTTDDIKKKDDDGVSDRDFW